jgi:hypothetical protein
MARRAACRLLCFVNFLRWKIHTAIAIPRITATIPRVPNIDLLSKETRGNLGVVDGVVSAVALGVNVSIEHLGELTLECISARFICIVARNLFILPSSSSQAYIIIDFLCYLATFT